MYNTAMRVINKIQRSGAAYYVYIPSKWIKDRNIYKGDYMELVSKPDGTLIIRQLDERKKYANNLRPADTDQRTIRPVPTKD